MNRLTKIQRSQLIGIAIGTLALMAALWGFGVTAMQSELVKTEAKSAAMRKELRDAEAKIRRESEINGTLLNRSDLLAKREAGLVPDRDAYSWLIEKFNAFMQSRSGVSIDTYSQPEYSDSGMIPKFPYRWATFHLKGTGYYHDIGKFFADFENTFPYYRIQSPILSVNTGAGMEAEKLSFSFDIAAPVINSSPEVK